VQASVITGSEITTFSAALQLMWTNKTGKAQAGIYTRCCSQRLFRDLTYKYV